MNVKIENQNLRFKISQEELNTLLGGHPIHAKVDLLDKILVATINPSGCSEALEPKLVLNDSEAYLNLLIPLARVQELSDMGQSRDGLRQEVGGVSVTLQVDMPEACHS